MSSTDLPWSPEAEQAVIGSLLLDNSLAHRVGDILSPEDFYNPAHAAIWSALQGLVVACKPADSITVCEALGTKANECGGLAYLQALCMSVASVSSIRRYAEIVAEKAQRRALILACDEAQAIARDDGAPADLLNRAQSLLMGLQRQHSRVEAVSLCDSVVQRLDRWTDLAEGRAQPGLRTRLPGLDKALGGGLQGGRVVVLAARPSVGKTSLAIQLGLNVAEDGHKVLVLSQEMPRGDLTDRIAACLGRIELGTLLAGPRDDDPDCWARLCEATEKARALPLWIDDQPALTPNAIRSKAVVAKHKHGLNVLILDYLQLCAAADRKLSRHHQIEEISRGLKTLAKELDITVIVLSQINREVAREDREPTLADLKESGAIEEDADVVLLLHPRQPLADGALLVACIVAKNRQGLKTRVALRFEGAYQRWTECAMDVSAAPPPARQPRQRSQLL